MRTQTKIPSSIAIIALHDVSPYWESEIERAMELLVGRFGIKPALLVVPDFHNNHPLQKSVEFSLKLKSWQELGCELVLHGYSHLDDAPGIPMSWSRHLRALLLTDGEGEFLNLTAAQTRERIVAGREALMHLGNSLTGFVPPAWLYNRHLPVTLSALGFQFYEGQINIYKLPNAVPYFMPAVSFCARDSFRARLSALYAIATSRLVRYGTSFKFRLALHPVDFRNEKLVDAITEFIAINEQRVSWQSYETILSLGSPGSTRSDPSQHQGTK